MKGIEPHPPGPQTIDSQHFEESPHTPRPLQAPRDSERTRFGLLKVIRYWNELEPQLQAAIVDLIEAALDEKGGFNEAE